MALQDRLGTLGLQVSSDHQDQVGSQGLRAPGEILECQDLKESKDPRDSKVLLGHWVYMGWMG